MATPDVKLLFSKQPSLRALKLRRALDLNNNVTQIAKLRESVQGGTVPVSNPFDSKGISLTGEFEQEALGAIAIAEEAAAEPVEEVNTEPTEAQKDKIASLCIENTDDNVELQEGGSVKVNISDDGYLVLDKDGKPISAHNVSGSDLNELFKGQKEVLKAIRSLVPGEVGTRENTNNYNPAKFEIELNEGNLIVAYLDPDIEVNNTDDNQINIENYKRVSISPDNEIQVLLPVEPQEPAQEVESVEEATEEADEEITGEVVEEAVEEAVEEPAEEPAAVEDEAEQADELEESASQDETESAEPVEEVNTEPTQAQLNKIKSLGIENTDDNIELQQDGSVKVNISDDGYLVLDKDGKPISAKNVSGSYLNELFKGQKEVLDAIRSLVPGKVGSRENTNNYNSAKFDITLDGDNLNVTLLTLPVQTNTQSSNSGKTSYIVDTDGSLITNESDTSEASISAKSTKYVVIEPDGTAKVVEIANEEETETVESASSTEVCDVTSMIEFCQEKGILGAEPKGARYIPTPGNDNELTVEFQDGTKIKITRTIDKKGESKISIAPADDSMNDAQLSSLYHILKTSGLSIDEFFSVNESNERIYNLEIQNDWKWNDEGDKYYITKNGKEFLTYRVGYNNLYKPISYVLQNGDSLPAEVAANVFASVGIDINIIKEKINSNSSLDNASDFNKLSGTFSVEYSTSGFLGSVQNYTIKYTCGNSTVEYVLKKDGDKWTLNGSSI